MRLHTRRFLAELSQLRLQGFAPLHGDFVLLLAECLALYFQLLYATLHRIYLHGHGVNFYAQTAGRLVHEVYGLVGEEAVAYVTVGEYGRRHQGGVLDAHPVVHFISFFESPQDGYGVFRARLPVEDGLEASFQSGIFLHVLPVLIKGSCADDPQFTTGCLLYTSPSPRDGLLSRMPSS